MSYSGSGAVATLWSPSNYNGATKIPVPSATRRYSTTTSSASAYRSSGSQERSYYSSSTNSYTSASRNVQTEYRSRFTTPVRSSASVPTSYSSRISELHETTSRLTSKDRSETNDNLSSYRRSSKTDSDVAATLEKYGIKSDAYKFRSDAMPNRFLNTSSLDSKYGTSRKLPGTSALELSRLSHASAGTSSKPPKAGIGSRLQRKDSLTKADPTDSGLSSIRSSVERKFSSSAVGGSSSPIDSRKPSEVWDKKMSVSLGDSVGSNGDSLEKADNKTGSEPGENEEVGLDEPTFDENVENEEKALTFEEIRKKFDNANDIIALKSGVDNAQKSSHEDSKACISNGVILGVHNFGQIQYLDRNAKNKKNSTETDEGDGEPAEKSDSNVSFSSPQTFRRQVLKPIPSAVKLTTNTNSNNTNNNNALLRKSPDSQPETAATFKKKSPSLSPDKKESFSSLAKLPAIPAADLDPGEKKSDEGEGKRESRNATISSKFGLDTKSDLKIQPKVKGEKLLSKIEATLLKQPDMDSEVLNVLSRLRSSPEGKPKDFENQTKVIELRRLDATAVASPFESEKKSLKEHETKEKPKEKKTEAGKQTTLKTVKPVEKTAKSSPVKDVKKETETLSPQPAKKDMGPGAKARGNSSPKEEKDSQNLREREMNKKLLEELTSEIKSGKKEEKDGTVLTKEVPMWDKNELASNINRTFIGQASTSQSSNPHSFYDRSESTSLHGTSPRSSLGRSRSSGGEKGGLNGLKNIGNTCFMNSVLQCLSNTKPLLEYLLNEDYLTDINFTISAMKGSLIKAFSNVIQELWAPNTEDRIINTTNFKSQIQKFAPRFMGYAQQDAQEFLRYLLEGLHEDVNRVTVKPQQILTDIDDSLSDNQKAAEAWKRYLRMDDSKVVDIFVGQLKSTLQCTVCGHCSVTFDPFWDLSLPVPSRTGQPRLMSCLDAFTKEEVLDGEEKPTCSKCETRRKCTKSFSIQKFPKILVLHLKRFSPTERYRGKLSVTVDFPLTGLDLSPYAANKGQGCTYNLYAISNHSGTAYGGHYTAYCKHPYTGNWHEYNDSRVSSLSSRSVVSGEAYVLFYELATQTSHL